MKITEKIHCLKIEFNVGEKISRFVNIYLLFGKKWIVNTFLYNFYSVIFARRYSTGVMYSKVL